MLVSLGSAISGTGVGPTWSVPMYRESDIVGVLQIYGTASSFSVTVEGRLSPDADWATIYTATAKGLFDISCCPEIRYNITSITGGNLSILLWRPS